MKQTLVACISLFGLIIVEAVLAHATVWPQESVAGAYEKYTIRIPNEKDSPTIRIEAEFPAEVTVGYFETVPGWAIEHTKDADGAIVGATWSRGQIGPHEFAEFAIMGVNPSEPTTMVWRVTQVHADGTRSEWAGAPESSNPAPATTVK